MKLFVFLILFIPLSSYGQKLEIAEQAGYSTTGNITGVYGARKTDGFSNQVSVGFHCTKELLISTFYEVNLWNPNKYPVIGNNHSFGSAIDITARHFFAGMNLQSTRFASVPIYGGHGFTFHDSPCIGIHAGSMQNITKHWSLVEYIGYSLFKISGTEDFVDYNHYTNTSSIYHQPITLSFQVFYIRAGLSYNIDLHKESKQKKVETK